MGKIMELINLRKEKAVLSRPGKKGCRLSCSIKNTAMECCGELSLQTIRCAKTASARGGNHAEAGGL